MDPKLKADLNNHGVQLNKNSNAFWRARGFNQRPNDWETRIFKGPKQKENPKVKKD